MKKTIVLGGGFGGMYAVMELEKVMSPGEAEITLVSKDNYLLFAPMLHEVAAGDVPITDIVCPVRRDIDWRIERDRVVSSEYLEALDAEGVWAIGDSAMVSYPVSRRIRVESAGKWI